MSIKPIFFIQNHCLSEVTLSTDLSELRSISHIGR